MLIKINRISCLETRRETTYQSSICAESESIKIFYEFNRGNSEYRIFNYYFFTINKHSKLYAIKEKVL